MSYYRWIPLTQGRHALVDGDDYERVSRHKWYAARWVDAYGKPYYLATRSIGRSTIQLHRFVMGIPSGKMVCFANRKRTLDCRKSNLRIVSRSMLMASRRKQHSVTSSQYKGVSRNRGKWLAQICVRGGQIYVGRYDTEEEAARSYNAAATLHFGEFALLNVIPTAL